MQTMASVLDRFRSGMRVFIAGSTGEPIALLDALADDPGRSAGLDIVTSSVPGINRFDWARLDSSAVITGLFMQPSLHALAAEGRYRHLPVSYSGFVQCLERDHFDIVAVHIAPAGVDGFHSLGPAVEFMPKVLKRASAVIGIVNPHIPALPGAPTIAPDRFTAIVEASAPIATYDVGDGEGISQTIADLIAPYVTDGMTLQAGLGKIPTTLIHHLSDRRRLKLHSGMLGDWVRRLVEADALDMDHIHRACAFVGSRALYDWALDYPQLAVRGCDETHDPATLAGIRDFIAINSAVEVDLFGQCALEHVGGRAISGAGGAPDFARAGRLAADGLSIVALPSTGARGSASRIVARLSPPGVVTLPRSDIDLIVTEHGVADLRGLDVDARARQIISIADPSFQDQLLAEWQELQ